MMQYKKIIVSVILSMIGIGGLIYSIFTPSKVKRELMNSGNIRVSTAPLPKTVVALAERPTRRDDHPSWNRNPFVSKEAERANGFVLNGILWDQDSPMAIINDEIISVGGKVGDATVMLIGKDRVVLNTVKGDIEFSLESEE